MGVIIMKPRPIPATGLMVRSGPKNDAAEIGRALGSALVTACYAWGRISNFRETRENLICKAFADSTWEQPYEYLREKYFRQAGVGTIDD